MEIPDYVLQRPADNVVLEFKNPDGLKILVISTGNFNNYKIVKGLILLNRVVNVSYLNLEQVKHLYIDSIVNGFQCYKNELLINGIKDCLSTSQTLN
jgi:hypothetical protein